jgi:hypothetical protein
MAGVDPFAPLPVISSFITQWHVSYESQSIGSIFSEWDVFTLGPPVLSDCQQPAPGHFSEYVNRLTEQFGRVPTPSSVPVLRQHLLSMLEAANRFPDRPHLVRLQQRALASVLHLSITAKMVGDRSTCTRCAAHLWKYASQFAAFYDQIVDQHGEVKDVIDHATNAQNRERVISDSDDAEPENDVFRPGRISGQELTPVFADRVLRPRLTVAGDSEETDSGISSDIISPSPADGGQRAKTVPIMKGRRLGAERITKTLIIRPEKLGADASLSEQVIREVCDKFGRHGIPGRGYRVMLMRAFREWRNEKVAKVRPVQVVEFNTTCNDIEFILAEKILIAQRVHEIQRLFSKARKFLSVL